MSKIRLRFTKTDAARFISHLDLMRTMKRAFLRAGIGLKYTQGFNPHPYMSVALPLPVGCESVCELIDVELIADTPPDGLPEALSHALPRGICVTEAYTPERKFADIARVRLEGRLICDGGASVEKLTDCLTRGSIVISKRTKSGVADLDIAPHIGDLSIFPKSDYEVQVFVTVSAQNPSVTPDNLVSAIVAGGGAPDHALFRRLELLDTAGRAFR